MSLPPMAEIDFWRDRSSKVGDARSILQWTALEFKQVSTVYEQLQLPGVKKATKSQSSNFNT